MSNRKYRFKARLTTSLASAIRHMKEYAETFLNDKDIRERMSSSSSKDRDAILAKLIQKEAEFKSDAITKVIDEEIYNVIEQQANEINILKQKVRNLEFWRINVNTNDD